MQPILRPLYLQKLVSAQGNGLIKIITGLRRCGKSFLLFRLFVDYLKESGVDSSHIIKIDLEDIRNEHLREPHTLVNYIDSQMKDRSMYYIIIDEVQNIVGFESVLNSYLKIDNADVYVTGSNSKFLSKDIATEFRGRGDVIHMYPLSFAEFYSAFQGDLNIALRNYMTYGGLPHILRLDSHERKTAYLEQIYSTVYLKDLKERESIGKTQEFDELVKIMASNIGAPCNPTKLSNTFKSVGQSSLSPLTIKAYLEMLEDAYLIEKAERYDVKGKKYIATLSKYYMTDMGIRNGLLEFRQLEETHLMENIIYNELKIRGFSVDVGIVELKGKDKDNQWFRKQLEVDFVANMNHRCYYIQSALAIPDETKMQQESRPLVQINDSFKKVIIVKDNFHPWYTVDGILILSLFDFLLNPKSIEY